MRVKMLFLTLLLTIQITCVRAQELADGKWSLTDCLNYAIENNIQIKQSRNNYQYGTESTAQAKAAMFPSVAASISQNYTNYPSNGVTPNNIYSGTYGLNAGMTLYKGGQLRNTLKREKVGNEIDSYAIDESINDIRIAIVQAYMQYLYSQESLQVAKNSVETSEAQRARGEQLWHAGSISKVDYAQLENQLATDQYQLVTAQANLESCKLQIKQLLELNIDQDIELVTPDIAETEVMQVLASKNEIYNRALGVMPQVQKAEKEVEASVINEKIAKSGYYPTLSLSASVGTGNFSNGSFAFGTQLWNSFNENVSLTLAIPIYSNRQNVTASRQAKITTDNTKLAAIGVEKELLKNVENVYLDVTSSQSQYKAAQEKLKFAKESFDLISEQYGLGMKNTVELLTAQNDYVSSQVELLQAKYMAVMGIELINIYQGKAINANY